jgi:hypothetical protein
MLYWTWCIDVLLLIIVFIEHVLNNLTQKKAWNWWKLVKRYKTRGLNRWTKVESTGEGLKIDPFGLGLEIGKPREWVENSKGSIFRPFPGVKTRGHFFPLFCIQEDKNDANMQKIDYWIQKLYRPKCGGPVQPAIQAAVSGPPHV